jgi:arabinan endo-1,5-alpha-L-arabinosidase
MAEYKFQIIRLDMRPDTPKNIHIIITTVLLSILFACPTAGSKDENETDNGNRYNNPVVNYSLPDPTVIKADDGYFYLYATEDIRNLPVHRSKDLVNWQNTGTAFTGASRPVFEPGGGLWAPDINFINGQYVLYYSMSKWGGHWTCGIGASTSDSPQGPFKDLGPLFISETIGVENSIDQFYIEEDNKKYLFWGSFHGIYAIDLSDDGLSIKADAAKRQVAGNAYEGVYIHKRDGFYYMFASTGSCCEGVNSTYTTVVGRSENLFGPYSDRQGQSMMDNKHEILIHGNERFAGTGHNSEIVTDDNGDDWILYHGVDKLNPKGRVLLLDKILWSNGWPGVKTSSPSPEEICPAF